MREAIKGAVSLMEEYKAKHGLTSDRVVVERYCLDTMGTSKPEIVDALLKAYREITGTGPTGGRQEKFSDRTDVDYKISLYEYGLIRNPKTDKVLYCLNVVDNYGLIKTKPIIKTTHITLEDVQECLAEMPDSYFSFIGSDRQTEVDRLTNEYLSHTITSADAYNGYFLERFY